MSDKKFQMTILFDFFGDLLSEKQREYFDLYYNEDFSLSEIAENYGISRQGVRDLIVHAENTLLEYEEKTGLVKMFSDRSDKIDKAEKIAKTLLTCSEADRNDLLNELINTLETLKG